LKSGRPDRKNVIIVCPLKHPVKMWCLLKKFLDSAANFTTVDGRNPAPVDRGFIPLFTGFQPSKVVQDFFHPQ